MRNLKKILALVLALVMSLSLMATASATDFKDDDQFTETYKVAAQVLEKLGVLKGDPDGSFRPTGSITRAEAAAAVYRIVTGDVEDKQVGIYADYNIFTDVQPGDWYAGYVNFCANAEYIKGNGDGTFSPNEKVNGYAALAMILRAIGYTANGGFTGDDWHIQAARTAEARKITKNIFTGTLGVDATRETVAEILFQAILVNMVNHNQDHTFNGDQGYFEINETLGHKIFGLEKISGVVIANEWANLKTNSVLDAGTTLLSVTNAGEINSRSLQIGDEITLDEGTDLAAVGMTYDAYVSGSGSSMKALTLTESDVNNFAFNEGDSVNTGLSNEDYGSILDLAKTGGISSLTDAEYYIDYQKAMAETATSEWLIRYAIAKSDVVVNSATYNFLEGLMGSRVETRTIKVTNLTTGVASDVECYLRSIRKGETITAIDLAVMEHIFDTADRVGDNTNTTGAGELRDYVRGEVYVGTSSLTDQSDLKSWREFQETYLVYDEQNIYNFCDMGDSLRVIDNDGDGVADYVLKVQYVQAKAIDTISDALVLSNGLRVGRYSGNKLYSPDELALNDIVNYNLIDGKLSIWKADMVNGKITNKSFEKITVTVDGGETYDQSAIDNATGLQGNIMNMTDVDEYNMYLDEFGNIRTYELALGTQYTLLTEMYPTSSQNWNYVTNHRYIAETKMGDADRQEYTVSNNSSDLFYAYNRTSGNTWFNNGYVWTSRNIAANVNGGNSINTATRYNYLQPAIAHLGYNGNTATANGQPSAVAGMGDWGRINYQVTATDRVFLYNPFLVDLNPVATEDPLDDTTFQRYSYTNVATYVMDGEEVILNTAAKNHVNTNNEQVYRSTVAGLAGQVLGQIGTEAQWKEWYRANQYPGWATMSTTDRNTATTAINAWWTARLNTSGNTVRADIYPVYATDYVQLVTSESYNPGDRHFTIDPGYANKYNTLSNTYVDATNATEFYIVTPTTIHHVVGFMNLMAIDSANVRAAYAVAQNTSKDQVGQDYWVADVIVIEVTALTYDFDSIALMYYNPDEATGAVRNVRSLNNSWRVLQPEYADMAKMNVTPSSLTWGNFPWNGGRFYAQYNTDLTSEGNLTAGSINQVLPGAARSVTPVNSNYSAYGIYAGTVSRIETLVGSNYIDVLDSLGNHHYVNVRSADYNTPVYRITTSYSNDVYVANTISLTNSLETSDVQPGDQIIWVYRHNDGTANAVKQAAYIVDVAPDTVGTVDWIVPAWLNSAPSVALGLPNGGLWQQIDADQTGGTSAADLIARAKALLLKTDPTMAELTSMITALTTAIGTPAGSTTQDQITEMTTLKGQLETLRDSGTVGYNAAKQAALDAIDKNEADARKAYAGNADALNAIAAAAKAQRDLVNAKTPANYVADNTIFNGFAASSKTAIDNAAYNATQLALSMNKAGVSLAMVGSPAADGTQTINMTLAKGIATEAGNIVIPYTLKAGYNAPTWTTASNSVVSNVLIDNTAKTITVVLTPAAITSGITADEVIGLSVALTTAITSYTVTAPSNTTADVTTVYSNTNIPVITLTAAANYDLPTTVNVSVDDGSNNLAGTAYTYSATTGKITLTPSMAPTDNIVITGTANPTARTVTVPANITSSPTTLDVTSTGLSLTADTGYRLPTTITLSVGGTELTAGTDYTYNNVSGAISFSAGTVTGPVVITGAAVATVAVSLVEAAGATGYTATPAVFDKNEALADKTIVIAKSASFPASITSITIANGDSTTTLTASTDYNYTAANGTITFTHGTTVAATGVITVTFAA